MNALSERLSGEPNNGEYFTIGIDGRGGAGKSTLARWLAGHALEGFAVSAADAYYEPVEDELVPGTFNMERFMRDVGSSVTDGKRSLSYRPYTWPGRPVAPAREIEVEGGLIHEGVKTFALPIDWDVTIWVDSPRSLCLDRYLSRPYSERKSDFSQEQLEVAGREYARQADLHVADLDPLNNADIVVSGTRSFEEQLEDTLSVSKEFVQTA